MSKHFVTFIGFSFFLASCAINTAMHEETMNVELGREEPFPPIFINDVFSIQGCVLLDSCKDGLLKEVSKIEILSDTIFVLDKAGQKCVCKFDMEGHFIGKIGKPGKGHGEYRFANDFTIDRHTGDVMILGDNSYIHLYDKNGIFKTSKCVNKSLMWNIQATDDGVYMSTNHQTFTSGENAFLLYKYDNKLDEVGKWISVLPNYMGMIPLQSAIFQTKDNKLYYTDDRQNSVFLYDEKIASFTKAMSINFPNPIPINLKKSSNAFMSSQLNYDYLKDFYVGEKVYYVTYFCKGKLFFSVVDKENGHVRKEGYLIGYYPRLFPIGKNEFFAVIGPEVLESFEEWNKMLKSCNFANKHLGNIFLVKLKMAQDY